MAGGACRRRWARTPGHVEVGWGARNRWGDGCRATTVERGRPRSRPRPVPAPSATACAVLMVVGGGMVAVGGARGDGGGPQPSGPAVTVLRAARWMIWRQCNPLVMAERPDGAWRRRGSALPCDQMSLLVAAAAGGARNMAWPRTASPSGGAGRPVTATSPEQRGATASQLRQRGGPGRLWTVDSGARVPGSQWRPGGAGGGWPPASSPSWPRGRLRGAGHGQAGRRDVAPGTCRPDAVAAAAMRRWRSSRPGGGPGGGGHGGPVSLSEAADRP